MTPDVRLLQRFEGFEKAWRLLQGVFARTSLADLSDLEKKASYNALNILMNWTG